MEVVFNSFLKRDDFIFSFFPYIMLLNDRNSDSEETCLVIGWLCWNIIFSNKTILKKNRNYGTNNNNPL